MSIRAPSPRKPTTRRTFFLHEYKDVYGVDYIADRDNITPPRAGDGLEAIERHRHGSVSFWM